MKLVDLMNGCMDAGDFRGVAACALAHPMSKTLEQPSVERLAAIAYQGGEINRCDELMLEIFADIVAARESLR